MTTAIDPNATVGQLVAERPARSRVFEASKIDYCCGGKMPLVEACRKKGIDPESIVELLRQSDAQVASDDILAVDAGAMELVELADHIEQTHHAYLRTELPRLDQMTEKVHRVHGEAEPRLAEVRKAFCALRDELGPHMMKEERILFPMIRVLASGGGPSEHGCALEGPINQMEFEHEAAGEALASMRKATDDYVAPDWACNTYRAMLDGLAQLERDMHQHVHKENNVLFPRALALYRS